MCVAYYYTIAALNGDILKAQQDHVMQVCSQKSGLTVYSLLIGDACGNQLLQWHERFDILLFFT